MLWKQKERTGLEYPQIYKLSSEEARGRGETALFRESKKMNVACKAAIEAAIRENFDGMHLKKECIRPVMEEYGTDRVEWVLANTLRHLNYDGRFSRSNREWAGSFAMPESGTQGYDPGLDFIVGSHPAVLDGFVDLVRREREEAREQPEKPSIKGQLAAPPVPGEKPAAKTKDREVR